MGTRKDVRIWLEESNRPVGAIVHTIENGQPLRAERTEDGWVFEKEGWQHDA